MKKDDFGDRMKGYEAAYETRAPRDCPVVVRIDGRSFSKFTSGLERPFDIGMTETMQGVTAALVERTHAKIGYTQSDEITLIYEAPPAGQMFFDGRVQKLASVLAGIASTEFALECPYRDRVRRLRPHFDCRVFSVPTRMEASNALLWRSQDCRKNSVSMVAQHYYTHKALQNKKQADMIDMLAEVPVHLEEFPTENIWGTYMKRVSRERALTDEEWQRIPEKHKPESRLAIRSSVERLDIDYFGDIEDRVGIIFDD